MGRVRNMLDSCALFMDDTLICNAILDMVTNESGTQSAKLSHPLTLDLVNVLAACCYSKHPGLDDGRLNQSSKHDTSTPFCCISISTRQHRYALTLLLCCKVLV